MILQAIIQVIFYFLMIPFTILMAILTSMFIYWRYLHRIMLSYLPPNTKPHVMGPNVDDVDDDDDDNHEEFHKEKDQKEDRCFLGERKFRQQQEEERVKLSAAKTATSIKNRIVMTKEIDSLMKKIVDNLLEYYLLVWYRPLIVYDQPKYQSKSTESLEHFREALRDNLWKLFSCFIDRLYNVNHVTFISQDLIYRLLKHFQNLKTSSSPPPPRSSSPMLVNDVVVGDGDVDEKHNIPNTKSDGDNQYDDSDDVDVHQQTTSKPMIGHRKNQPSSSSIQTNFSSTSSNCSGLSSICQPNQSSIGDADDDDDDKQSIGSQRPVASQLLDHLNPFKSTENISTSASKTANDDPNHNHNSNNNKCFFYPLASHLAGEMEEKSLIHSLARFILDILINDSSGYDDDQSDGQKLSLIRDSRTLRSFLDDLLAKILYEAIQTITQPTMINCQIVKILESNFLLKDFIMKRNGDGDRDGNAASEFDGDDDDDESDDDEDDDDNDYSQIMSKKSVFILNEMKQCLVDNNFDHLYELIDKCNNVKLLKHIRLKLIAEILDAAVVSHLDKTVVGITNMEPSYWQENQSRRSSNSSSAGGGGDYNPRQRHFNFNAKMDLKFKKFRKEKNLKRLVNRLKFAKTICEQKIQFRRRTLASALPDPNHVDTTSRDGKVMETFDDFDDISFKNDLVKSVSLDDSIFAHAHSTVQSGDRSGSLADQLVADQDAKPRPKHKKIFKFQQIMANEFSRDYFRIFLQQSLLQNDSNVNKRSSLMKFRKDVLLVDCTIYMFEFWLHLQLIFQTLLDWLQASNSSSASSGSKSKHHHSLYESFKDSYNLLMIMVADQRFFYTFSRQFLSIPSDLMRSLERFLLGDLELNAMDISKISFQLNNVQECFLFQQNTTIKVGQTTADVLQKIDWRKHFQVFERLEKILFNCLNDEFYPQFLISKEYDEILLKYFEHGQSMPRQPGTSHGKPTMILMDLRKKLPIEDWYDYWNNAASLRKSYMFQLDHRLRVKPVNKILLVNGQPRKSGLNSIGDSYDKKFIDLHKNRKMLLNTIEFPFCYLSFVQVVHMNRFKLKWTIKQIVEEFVQKRSEEPEDMSMNRLLEDLLSNLGKDLARLGDQIDQIKRILLRTFCWLNADFSTVINNCRFDGNYEELLLSSTVNTAESKILSFVENLFLKPSSSSSSSSSSSAAAAAAAANHSNDPFSSSSDNLKFKVNVTALLSKFQYIHQQQQQQKLPTLPHTVRNELMSNWSYQWSVDITLQQLQTFHHRILIPFIRIIIFLARFQIKNYCTTIMDVLLDCSRDTDMDTDTNIVRRPTNNSPFGSKHHQQQRHLDNNNDIKILEKFVNKTNQILVEIRQIKRSMLNELKRNRFYFGTLQDTTSSAKHVPDPIQNQTGGAAATTTTTTISFKNLLKKEQQQQSIEVVDMDVQEVTESCSLSPPKNLRESTTMNNNEQNRLLKSMESVLNSYFQQIIAQDTIVKSIGFLHLIQYDQQSTPETGGGGGGSYGRQECCLRCQLYDWMFDWNQDHGLNHFVQMFLFRLLFDDHYRNRCKSQDGHGHGHEDDDHDHDHYWETLMNQMLDPNSNGGGHQQQQQQQTMAANKRTDPTDPAAAAAVVRLNSKLFFMQTRSLLMDRSALDCFDFTLDSLKCFTGANRTFCLECDRIMIDSRRRMIMQSSSSASFPATTYQRTNNHQQQSSSLHKFRLFINLSLDLDDQDHHHQSTCSSTSNLMDLISNVGNSIGFGGGGGGGNAHKQTNSSSTTTTSSSSSSIFNLGNLFSSSSNKHQPPPPASTATGNSSTNSSNNIPDLLLNGGNLDEPSLFSLFNDENQLIEPLFLLLIEIFELEGGTVTKTLRRTLMFGMRLFFGQTKMMSRPYKQFMQTLFTEKNVFRWMSKVNAYLEELLKNQQQQQPAKSSTTAAASRQHSRESGNPQPDVDLKIPDVDDNEDEYLKYLNDMLGSLETEKVSGHSGGGGQDHHQASSNDGGVRIVQATAVSDCQPSTSADDGVVDEGKYLVEDDEDDEDGNGGGNDGEDPILDEEQQRQLIRDRKLQIIAKQMLFVSIPTFLSHLFGQQNIDKGVNKCFDMLQYQKLNKHLVYEFIEAFLLEYFPEFRKLSTAATITTDGPMAEQQEQEQELD